MLNKEQANVVPNIIVPKYKEEKWMFDANIEFLKEAMDGVMKGFPWKKTKEGTEYWSNVYRRLYIMHEHLKVYSVIKRIS